MADERKTISRDQDSLAIFYCGSCAAPVGLYKEIDSDLLEAVEMELEQETSWQEEEESFSEEEDEAVSEKKIMSIINSSLTQSGYFDEDKTRVHGPLVRAVAQTGTDLETSIRAAN